jgi:hypothetical protein
MVPNRIRISHLRRMPPARPPFCIPRHHPGCEARARGPVIQPRTTPDGKLAGSSLDRRLVHPGTQAGGARDQVAREARRARLATSNWTPGTTTLFGREIRLSGAPLFVLESLGGTSRAPSGPSRRRPGPQPWCRVSLDGTVIHRKLAGTSRADPLSDHAACTRALKRMTDSRCVNSPRILDAAESFGHSCRRSHRPCRPPGGRLGEVADATAGFASERTIPSTRKWRPSVFSVTDGRRGQPRGIIA